MVAPTVGAQLCLQGVMARTGGKNVWEKYVRMVHTRTLPSPAPISNLRFSFSGIGYLLNLGST